MTDRPDLPDVARRRHLDRLRADLGLRDVPHYVGSELRTLGPVVHDLVHGQLQQRLLGAGESDSLSAALSAGERQLLLGVLVAAAEEFAQIVEDRPLRSPTVAAMLDGSTHEVDDPEQWHQTLCSAFRILSAPMRGLWAQLPQTRRYVALLDTALTRYVACLSTSVGNAVRRTREHRALSAEDARDALVEMVEHRWGGQAVRLCLRISTRLQLERATAAGAPANAASTGRRAAIRVPAEDHQATIVPHPLPASRSPGGRAPAIAVWVGPTTAADVAPAYDTALLLFRLVGAGIAAPPPPQLLPLPDFGFLRPSPDEANVQKVADLLRPLTDQRSAQRRVTLARTLQLSLRAGETATSLARQLGVAAQTVRNRLGALRDLYDSPDLDFGPDTLAIRAALDLLLPLWEHERRVATRIGRENSGFA